MWRVFKVQSGKPVWFEQGQAGKVAKAEVKEGVEGQYIKDHSQSSGCSSTEATLNFVQKNLSGSCV